MKFLLVYTTISVIGLNAKGEEVVTYDLVSRMVDLEVELAPELTKGSRTSASTSAFFKATHVITMRDALKEFVAAEIWPSRPRWRTWAFSMKLLPELDHKIQSPKFNVKCLKGKQTKKYSLTLRKRSFR
jgi:hypothetical protein